MPLYIPWLTETIKKRGVRYLLHHYLGQFFEEKLTLEQLSIDIYEGKGSIRNLALDVDELNDELDFVPFKFLDGCLIGQISVEVPWSSLATEACKVELEGAKFVCRLKNSADSNCTESAMLSRSLMTSSMQMAEEIVTTEDDEACELPNKTNKLRERNQTAGSQDNHGQATTKDKSKDNFKQAGLEGLEMFAQLIDSVLRRTKITARNTLFQLQPYKDADLKDKKSKQSSSSDKSNTNLRHQTTSSRSSGDEFSEPLAGSGTDEEKLDDNENCDSHRNTSESANTVEFFIKFFRCEEIVDQTESFDDHSESSSTTNTRANKSKPNNEEEENFQKSLGPMPETVTKLLTLEDVEMRIGGLPVSNLIGRHTLTIKLNGQKSDISIFSGSPLLAVISHKQLETFFKVFESAPTERAGSDLNVATERKDAQKVNSASAQDQAAQFLESSLARQTNEFGNFNLGGFKSQESFGGVSGQVGGAGGRRWVGSGEGFEPTGEARQYHNTGANEATKPEPTLENIEAFSCELKLPGIWLCILKAGETLPPLIRPYADSINSFRTINKYIDDHIKVPHIRFLALKVALDITSKGTNIFFGDLDISEQLQDNLALNPSLRLLNNDSMPDTPIVQSRYKASIVNNRDVTVELLTKTRILIDPTMIDRLVYDYKIVRIGDQQAKSSSVEHVKLNNCNNERQQQQQQQGSFNFSLQGEQLKIELLCPIPDLTADASYKTTQLRPQSFLFELKDLLVTWQSSRLDVSSKELVAYIKTQPKQSDGEATKFIESSSRNADKITLVLEPSPCNLDDEFPNDIEQALNESSMYESIYVSQATESQIPTEAFQTKRKVVRASFDNNSQQSTTSNKVRSEKINECDHERILTPGDRKHLLNYLNQTVMSTKFSLNIHLPICEVDFEDKEQLDLIYNRFGNDFVFWKPKVLCKTKESKPKPTRVSGHSKVSRGHNKSSFRQQRDSSKLSGSQVHFRHLDDDEDESTCETDENDAFSSDRSTSTRYQPSTSYSKSSTIDCYDNEVTCKITVDEVFVRFNHQSCASAMRQEILVENLLLGVVIDVKRKPNTLLSLVADNLELSTDSRLVLESNSLSEKTSIFSLTTEIKRPTKSLKDIKLAIQIENGLFRDLKTETYKRFWQSINVTDEPISGYVAPKIVTELHIDFLNTSLLIVKEGARPALLALDELYITTMIMEQTSQVMIRLIADEVSLYMKRNKSGLETMKNYICLIDSGLIDLDVRFSQDGKLEFGVINNVITVRVCQDSMSALCKLFNALVRNSEKKIAEAESVAQQTVSRETQRNRQNFDDDDGESKEKFGSSASEDFEEQSRDGSVSSGRELNLLVDAMNDFDDEDQLQRPPPLAQQEIYRNLSKDDNLTCLTDEYRTANASDNDDFEPNDEDSASSSSGSSGSESSSASDRPLSFQQTRIRTPEACLLDESNPVLGDLFSPPLVPLIDRCCNINEAAKVPLQDEESSEAQATATRAMDESGFFVLGDDDVGAGIIDKQQHEPVVRKLIDGPITIIENHFKMTKPRTIPAMLASSLERYVLEEMTLVVNLFGGRDFDDDDQPSEQESTTSASSTNMANTDESCGVENLFSSKSVSDKGVPLSVRSRAGSVASTNIRQANQFELSGAGSASKRRIGPRRKHVSESATSCAAREFNGKSHLAAEPRVRFGDGAVNLWESLDLMSSPDFLGTRSRPNKPPLNSDSKQAGGTWRQNDVCIHLVLSKVKLLYEIADSKLKSSTLSNGAPISWRFMLFIQDIEVQDKVAASDINKMLYEYCTETMPKRNTQMLTIKNTATINQSDGCEECDLRVSLKPLRLNIDQDTLFFLIDFFSTLFKSLAQQQSIYSTNSAGTIASASQANSSQISSPASDVASPALVTSGNASSATARRRQQASRISSPQSTGRQQRDSLNLSAKKFPPESVVGGGESQNCTSSVAAPQAKRTSSAAVKKQQQECTRLDHPTGPSTSSSSSPTEAVAPNSLSTPNLKGGSTGRATGSSPSSSTTATIRKTEQNEAAGCGGGDGDNSTLPTHCHTDHVAGSVNQQPIYIKSFTFSPDVPIRLDYHAKHLDFEQGALAGILMGLAHLDHSELILRRVLAKHGMRGIERVLMFCLNFWVSDMKRNQLPSILSGVGPMHSVLLLFKGMRDLIWMPIDHYRRDKRLVRGLQRGASSFSSSTAMAAINLVNRFISIVQCTAQIAHDIVTPSASLHAACRLRPIGSDGHCDGGGAVAGGQSAPGSNLRQRHAHHHHRSNHHHHHHHHHAVHPSSGSSVGGGSSGGGLNSSSSAGAGLNQPRNFCEGVAVGFNILKEGLNDTARNVSVGVQAEDMRSAVGELVRQIPSTLLNPIISATEGAQSVLVGIRNQIVPDARRDDQEKWKRRVRGK